MKIIACNSSKSLAEKISKHINVPLADASANGTSICLEIFSAKDLLLLQAIIFI